ncbi:MAG: PKD domain-containing protein, partial [Planctomycetota bacterium]|nr:PKD domain-containing protein [Planctomycetota bacterium]
SIRAGTCIHEWMHLAGLEHRSETTSASVPFDPQDRAAPYLMSYGFTRNELNRYERLQMLAWPGYAPGQPASGEISRGENALNQPPLAIAACLVDAPQVGKAVMLSASASFDPDAGDTIAAWRWQQISGPAVVLADADTPFPSFIPWHAGVYTFALTVIDSRGRVSETSTSSVVQLTVAP